MAINTVPTGLLLLASGPATPVTDNPISAPEVLIASAVSDKFLYFPVPTISLDFKFILSILNLSKADKTD